MNKTMTVNIAGMVYHIDEDAFFILNQYLNRVKEELKDTDGGNEIYLDIETRIGELFSEKIRLNRQVITASDVKEVIAVMGEPSDISGSGKKMSYDETYSRRYRRMYRDPENRLLGGVCSGLAAYWGMDPTLLRLIFIILAIFGMAGVIIYIILWIILPEARTVAQKLEMRGEKVNLSNMGEFFREEFDNVKRGFKK